MNRGLSIFEIAIFFRKLMVLAFLLFGGCRNSDVVSWSCDTSVSVGDGDTSRGLLSDEVGTSVVRQVSGTAPAFWSGLWLEFVERNCWPSEWVFVEGGGDGLFEYKLHGMIVGGTVGCVVLYGTQPTSEGQLARALFQHLDAQFRNVGTVQFVSDRTIYDLCDSIGVASKISRNQSADSLHLIDDVNIAWEYPFDLLIDEEFGYVVAKSHSPSLQSNIESSGYIRAVFCDCNSL